MRNDNTGQDTPNSPEGSSDRALALRAGQSHDVTPFDNRAVGGVHGDETIELRELWQILIRRRWTIVAVAIIIVVAAFLMTLLIIPEYRATTQIQINPPGGSRILEYGDFTAQQTRFQDYLNTQTQIIRSRRVMERVIRNEGVANHPDLTGETHQRNIIGELVGLLRMVTGNDRAREDQSELDPAARERLEAARVAAAAGRLGSRVSVAPVRGTELINLSVTGFNPEFVARMANAIADEYVQSNMQRRVDAGAEARVFLEDQLADMRITLERADQNLMEFAKANNIADLDEREQMALTALRRLSTRQSEIKAELVQLQTWRDLIGQGRVETLQPVVESPVILDLQRRLLDARTEYVTLSERFLDGYPAVQEVLSRIEGLKAEIQTQQEVIVRNIVGRYENLTAQAAALQEAIERAESQILSLNERSVQYNILQREFETSRELYDGLLQRMKEIGVAAGVRENNISIIDRARRPGAPFRPNLSRNLVLAVILGLMAGTGLVFLLEFLDRSIRRIIDIERIVDRPVLGIIPLVRSARDRSSLLPFDIGRQGAGTPDGAADTASRVHTDDDQLKPEELAAVEEATVAMLSAIKPSSALAESVRSLRTSLNFATAQGMPEVLMITSTASLEGKTTCAVNLATVMAQSGSRVLLVDADLRRPRLHKEFGVDKTPGLTDQITHFSVDSLANVPYVDTEIEGLSLLPAGSPTPNPTDMLASTRLTKILDELRTQFDHIVIDSSPILGLADALTLARQTEGLVFVARSGQTVKDDFKMSMKRLAQVRAPVLGVILNGVNLRDPEYSYYSAYYHYYGAHLDEDDDGDTDPAAGAPDAPARPAT